MHGFPESSNIFRDSIDHLASKFTCVVTFDFLGFGLSDKPNDIVYSIDLHTKLMIHILKEHGITGAHFLSHDMGTSVLTELNSLQLRKELPVSIKSMTFTNGNMVMKLASLRVSQVALLNPVLGWFAGHLTNYKSF